MGTQQPEPPVPADALMFDFPPYLAPMMFGGSILFFALGSLVVVLEITQPSHGSLAVLLLCVAVCSTNVCP